jgi:hypothetical protein
MILCRILCTFTLYNVPSLPEGDDVIKEPMELLGRKLNLDLRIMNSSGLPTKHYSPIFCKYSIMDTQYSTQPLEDSMDFNYSSTIHIDNVNLEFLSYIESNALTVEARKNTFLVESSLKIL